MFTDCPACARQFRIRADQLSAAEGQVKCGYCGEQFNAISRLRDVPLAQKDVPVPVVEETQALSEPEFHIPGLDTPESESDAVTEAVVDAHSTLDTAQPQVDLQPEAELEPDYEFPQALLETPVKRSGWFSRLVWTLLVLTLLLAVIAQLSWFNRDQLLSRYPELRPYARQLCDRFHCELIRHRNVAAIKILNRDVRDHPRFEGALLVNATMVNSAGTIQSFPRIQLGLFDTNGKLLAYREFSSDDYLDDSIDAENGMFPDTPIHIVLEVIGATDDAVSFEFRFL